VVHGQSAPRRTSSGSLSPLLFLGGTDGILLPDGTTHELVEGPALEGHQLLTDLGTQSFVEHSCLLCIRVNLVCTILHKVCEPLAVLIHHAGTLLKVQELLLLVVHEAIRDVVLAEILTELSPRHLMAIRKGGSEGRPPGTCRPTELLGREQRLLCLRAAKKTELGLGHAKPAVSLQRVHGLREYRWVCHQKVRVGRLVLQQHLTSLSALLIHY
jgi:hypothetical protein